MADSGPAQGDPKFEVDDQDSEGRWPSPVCWSHDDGRHVYVLKGIMLMGSQAARPLYAHERRLEPVEDDPPEGRMKAPR